MRGFILAAGFGTRLQPITDHVPKALVSVCGKPLLERSLAFLAHEGITTIGVNTHYMADQVAAFQERSPHPFSLFHEQGNIRGTGGGLYFAREFLAADEAFFVCNVDIVYRFSLTPLIDKFLKTGWAACLLAVPAKGAGTIFCDKETWLYRGISADNPPGAGVAPMDFIGAALYRRRFLDVLTEGDFSVVPVWKRATERGFPVGVLEVDNCYWRDIGTPASLASIHFDALNGLVDLEAPPELVVDTERARCFHRDLPSGLQHCIGPFAWVEAKNIPEECRISRSVVYANALMSRPGKIENLIMTPYGEVQFGQ